MIFQSLETIGRRSLEFWTNPLASPLAQRSTPRPSCWPTSRRRLRAASGWGCFSIFDFHFDFNFNFKVDVRPRYDRHHDWLCKAHPQQHAFRGYLFVHYILYLQFSTRSCSKFKVGGSMGLWLGLGVIQAIQLFAKYLLPFFRWKTREGSIKVAGWMSSKHSVCSSSMEVRFLLEGVQMTCRPCLKICFCQCFDVNIIVDLSYPPKGP